MPKSTLYFILGTAVLAFTIGVATGRVQSEPTTQVELIEYCDEESDLFWSAVTDGRRRVAIVVDEMTGKPAQCDWEGAKN